MYLRLQSLPITLSPSNLLGFFESPSPYCIKLSNVGSIYWKYANRPLTVYFSIKPTQKVTESL